MTKQQFVNRDETLRVWTGQKAGLTYCYYDFIYPFLILLRFNVFININTMLLFPAFELDNV